MKPLHLLPLVSAVLLVGCQEGMSTDTGTSSAPNLESVQFGLRPDLSVAQRMEGVHATLTTLVPIFSDPEEGWETKQRRLEAAIAAAPDSTRFMIEQAGAVQMLTHYLTSGESEGQAAAANTYVEALIRNSSPELPVVAESVSRFATVWGPERTATLSARAADVGAGYLEQQRACADCSVPSAVERAPASDGARGESVFNLRVAEAVEQLRARAR